MRKICFVVMLFFMYCGTKGQINIDREKHRTFINPDSIFSVYTAPKIPEEFSIVPDSSSGEYSCFIMTSILISPNNRVKAIYCYPIYNMDNLIPIDSPLWTKMINNIKEASKTWVFKPVNYVIKNEYDSITKEKFKQGNEGKNPYYRPFGAIYRMLLLIQFDGPGYYREAPNIFYWLAQ